MQALNLKLFYLINAGPYLSGWFLIASIIIAKYVVFIIPLWMVGCWLWRSPAYRGTLVFAIVTAMFALLLSKMIGFIWHTPRPFVLDIGHTYLAHAPDASFPSDHATFMWAVSLCLLTQIDLRFEGIIFLLLAILVGWSRVFVGIHFPVDIVGGFLIATFAFLAVHPLRNWLNQSVLPIAETVYQKLFFIPINKGFIRK